MNCNNLWFVTPQAVFLLTQVSTIYLIIIFSVVSYHHEINSIRIDPLGTYLNGIILDQYSKIVKIVNSKTKLKNNFSLNSFFKKQILVTLILSR